MRGSAGGRTLPSIIELAHGFVARAMGSGGVAVDATAGNGNDTVFLAQLVGAEGRVFAFDVQEAAIRSTAEKLVSASLADRVTLVHDSHANMLKYVLGDVNGDVHGPVRAVMFNLGYLPRGDKSVITRADSTLAALEASLSLLAPGGIIVAVLYVGHPGGQEEADAVMDWSEELDPKRYQVFRYDLVNVKTNPPFLLAIEKKGS